MGCVLQQKLKIGSGGWIRTSDLDVNSILRYRCATPEYNVYYTAPGVRRQGVSKENVTNKEN